MSAKAPPPTSPPPAPSLYAAYLQAMADLAKKPGSYQVEIDFLTAWAVGMALQMVCRHPAVSAHSTMRKMIEPVGRAILAQLGQHDAALQMTAEVGWIRGQGVDVTQLPAPDHPGPAALVGAAIHQMLQGNPSRLSILLGLLIEVGRDEGVSAAQLRELVAQAYQVSERMDQTMGAMAPAQGGN